MNRMTRKRLRVVQSVALIWVGCITCIAHASVQGPVVTTTQDIVFNQETAPLSISIEPYSTVQYAGWLENGTGVANIIIAPNAGWQGYVAMRPDPAINPGNQSDGFVATNREGNGQIRYVVEPLDFNQSEWSGDWLYFLEEESAEVFFKTKGEQQVPPGDYHFAVEAGTYNP